MPFLALNEWVPGDKTRSIPPSIKWNYGCMDKFDDANTIVVAKYCRELTEALINTKKNSNLNGLSQ